MGPEYTFKAKIWLYSGEGAWHFLTLPEKYANEIKMVTSSSHRKGFGSVKVIAKIGNESWSTSIFPDAKSKSYLLPIKKEVRLKNNLQAGKNVKVVVSIVDANL